MPLTQWLEPLQSLRGVHGVNGVTHISLWRGFVTSCGRDGHSRTFSLHPHTGSLTELSSYRVYRGEHAAQAALLVMCTTVACERDGLGGAAVQL